MKSYVQLVIISYVQEKRKQLGLADSQPALVLLDEFKGQTSVQYLVCLSKKTLSMY